MLIPFALFVGLLVATAVIAHVSDNLGKKLGKKRVSVLGLRPRHTATLLTIGSSWGIMIFTLFMLLIVVAPLRKALFSYESERERLLGQVKDAKSELQAAQFSVVGLRKRTDELQKKSNDLQNDVRASQENARESQRQAREYQGQAKEFKGQAQDAQRNLQTARRGEQSARRGAQAALSTAKNAQSSAREAVAAAKNAQIQRATAETALANTERELKVNEQRLVLSQRDFKVAQSRLKQAQDRLRAAGQRLILARQQLVKSYGEVVATAKQKVQAEQDAAQAQQEAIQAQNQAKSARDERDRAQSEVNALQTSILSLQDRAQALRDAAIDYRALSGALAYGDISLPVDQTLAERRFDATRSPQEIERELRILVDSGRAGLKQFVGEATLVVTASIPDESGEDHTILNDQAIKFYAEVLASANQTVSARLVAAFNYPRTTASVFTRFVFIPIRTIYLARENIAERKIDTNKTESAIFRQLQDLVDEARKAAVARGAAPPLSPEAVNFFDGDTGPKIFDALRAVQKFDKPVRVRIVAARDLDSAEPLQIRFVVGDEA